MNEKPQKPKWRTPKPSKAKLKIPKKSSKHFVGQTTFGEDKGQGQCLGFGSMVEHNASLVLIYPSSKQWVQLNSNIECAAFSLTRHAEVRPPVPGAICEQTSQ